MAILAFNPAPQEEFLDSLPEIDELDPQELKDLEAQVREAIAALDAVEPRNENSEAYDLWAEQHEDLEDVLDEILDRLEEL